MRCIRPRLDGILDGRRLGDGVRIVSFPIKVFNFVWPNRLEWKQLGNERVVRQRLGNERLGVWKKKAWTMRIVKSERLWVQSNPTIVEIL